MLINFRIRIKTRTRTNKIIINKMVSKMVNKTVNRTVSKMVNMDNKMVSKTVGKTVSKMASMVNKMVKVVSKIINRTVSRIVSKVVSKTVNKMAGVRIMTIPVRMTITAGMKGMEIQMGDRQVAPGVNFGHPNKMRTGIKVNQAQRRVGVERLVDLMEEDLVGQEVNNLQSRSQRNRGRKSSRTGVIFMIRTRMMELVLLVLQLLVQFPNLTFYTLFNCIHLGSWHLIDI